MKKSTKVGMTALGITAALAGGTVAGVYLDKDVLQRNGLNMPAQEQDEQDKEKLEQELREKIEKELNQQFEQEKQALEEKHKQELEEAKQQGGNSERENILEAILASLTVGSDISQFEAANGDSINVVIPTDKYNGLYVFNANTMACAHVFADNKFTENPMLTAVTPNEVSHTSHNSRYLIQDDVLYAIKDDLSTVEVTQDIKKPTAIEHQQLTNIDNDYYFFDGDGKIFKITGTECSKITAPEAISNYLNDDGFYSYKTSFQKTEKGSLLLQIYSQTGYQSALFKFKDSQLEMILGNEQKDNLGNFKIPFIFNHLDPIGEDLVIALIQDQQMSHKIALCQIESDSVTEFDIQLQTSAVYLKDIITFGENAEYLMILKGENASFYFNTGSSYENAGSAISQPGIKDYRILNNEIVILVNNEVYAVYDDDNQPEVNGLSVNKILTELNLPEFIDDGDSWKVKGFKDGQEKTYTYSTETHTLQEEE